LPIAIEWLFRNIPHFRSPEIEIQNEGRTKRLPSPTHRLASKSRLLAGLARDNEAGASDHEVRSPNALAVRDKVYARN
jgi:hypothetical protein